MALEPRIEAVRAEYGLSSDDFWQIPQNKQWVCKHAALEVVAVKAKIEWQPPQIIQADSANGIAVLAVSGKLGDRLEWATGEASPKNNKNSYPWAMAEKRAKDRVVLKLAGIHGLVYSEDEADDFKRPEPAPANEAGKRQVGWSKDGTTRTAHSLKKEKVWDEFQMELLECETPSMVTKLALAWSKKVEDDSWPESWKTVLREEMQKRMDMLRNRPVPDDDTFPGDRPSGIISTLQAG